MGQIAQTTTLSVDSTAMAEEPVRYAVIAGRRIALPTDAKFYFQDKRGLWFWSKRKPRIKRDDWTAKKEPVQVCTEKGYNRCLQTEPAACSKHWSKTLMQTVNLGLPPLASAPELDDLSRVGVK
jgi:hypothetical protein